MPEDLVDFLISELISSIKNVSFDNYYGWGYTFSCDQIADLPSLDLMLDGVWLEVFVEDYVQILGQNTCAFCIADGLDSYTSILGNVLMRNYYVIHDMDHDKTAFGVLDHVDHVKA